MPVHVYTVLSEKHFSVISHIHFMSFEVDKKIGKIHTEVQTNSKNLTTVDTTLKNLQKNLPDMIDDRIKVLHKNQKLSFGRMMYYKTLLTMTSVSCFTTFPKMTTKKLKFGLIPLLGTILLQNLN